MALAITPEAHAATYNLTITPTRTQESNTPAVVLAVNVTGATIGATYKFTWTVTDPSGNTKPGANQTVATSTSLVLSIPYPTRFGTNINFVGNYTVNVQQNNPTNINSIATGQFQVGLTDKTVYQRAFPVSITARGYQANENVTINISHLGVSAPGYPTWQNAYSDGTFSRSWTIPPSIPTGLWTISLTGKNTAKNPPDTQAFTAYPTNVTLSSLNTTRAALQRSLPEEFRFTANYLSGLQAQTGSGIVRLTETDGVTTHYVNAYYDSTLGAFAATYRVPLTAPVGAWVASIDPAGFNDSYSNGGPSSSTVRGFTVQLAALTVTVIVPSQTYTVGDVLPVYAKVTAPDGSLFTDGTIVASLSFNTTEVGNPISLTYVQGQSEWAGGYVVKSSDPSGLWLVTVRASDSYGNTGQGIISAVVSVPPTPPPNATNQQPLDLYLFGLVTLVLGAGGSSLLVLRRFNTTRQPFEELYKLTGGELSPATVLLVLGEPGSGTSVLGLELVHQQLQMGRPCGILAYDTFPTEIQRTMKNMDWDVSSHLASGSLKILDCYSALAGKENAEIRDPMDFTEVSIQVTSMIDAAKEGPITILLDSITSIFNGAQARIAVNFLRVLAAKVKNSKGILIITGAKGSIPSEAWSNIENVVDGVIELGMRRSGESLIRTLTVARLADRKASLTPREFEITPDKGILFKKPRIPLGILSPKVKNDQA